MGIACVSCKPKNAKPDIKSVAAEAIIVVDSSRVVKTSSPAQSYPLDTLLESGWSIRYYTKNDSSENSDLYVECSKLKKKFVYKAAEVLQLRSYFIPKYIGESQNCLYFRTACGTSCRSLLTLNKNQNPRFRLFNSVIDYNITEDAIAYIDDAIDYEEKYIVSVARVSDNKVKTIHFRNFCNLNGKEGCVDSIKFSGGQVTVFATLNEGNNYYKDKVVKERKSVSFR